MLIVVLVYFLKQSKTIILSNENQLDEQRRKKQLGFKGNSYCILRSKTEN
jgi:hypothetical protein